MRVALEYDWSGDTEVDTAALRAFIATVTGGRQASDGTVFLDGMYVTARADSEDDVNPAMRLFGFEDRFWATFRFANLADEATSEHNTALMVHVLIAFAQRRGGAEFCCTTASGQSCNTGKTASSSTPTGRTGPRMVKSPHCSPNSPAERFRNRCCSAAASRAVAGLGAAGPAAMDRG